MKQPDEAFEAESGGIKMKKEKLFVLAISLLLLSVPVFAHGAFSKYKANIEHDELEEIMEEGTYTDLTQFREEYQVNVMPWIQDEETFKEAQERHVAMEEFHEEHGYGMHGFGMHGFGMVGSFGHGCHSW